MPGSLLRSVCKCVLGVTETLLAAVPPTWHCEHGPVPEGWRANPFREGVADAAVGDLMPELAVGADVYPLHYIVLTRPLAEGTADAASHRNAEQNDNYIEGDETNFIDPVERPHVEWTMDDFMANVPCGDMSD